MKYEQLRDRNWLAQRVAEMRMREIADMVGCSHSAVYQACQNLGLTIPHRVRHRPSNKGQAVKDGLRRAFPNGRFGEMASNWRGGRQVINGYVWVYDPERKRRVQEHRLVAEQYLGRRLEADEVVHHKNGNRLDNRWDNLEVVIRGQHVSNHFRASHEVLELRAENKALKATLTRYEGLYGLLD